MAQFYQVAGTQLALPDYARVDLAYQWPYVFSNPAAGVALQHTVSGAFIEVPLTGSFDFTTSNQVGNRGAETAIEDQGNNLFGVGLASAAQAASTTVAYQFSVGTVGAYGPISSVAAYGIPTVAMSAGWSIFLGANNIQTLDQVTFATLLVVRIPTGPSVASATPQLTPTPLIA